MIKFRELLFLKSLKGVGKAKIYRKYWKILNECRSLDDMISKIEDEDKFSIRDIDLALEKSQKSYDDAVNDKDVFVITTFDDNYPEKLMIMGNKRPLILYVKGNADALTKPNISVIGTRKPSKISEKFEKDLVQKTDRVVLSGLALGCDTIAHQMTVDKNKTTVAVLPTGVDVINPSSNKKLAEDILKTGGCLVSEYELGSKAFKGTYVERDALVAALSDAVFVVECAIKSGTMHTVEAAQKYEKNILTFIPENIPEGEFEGNLSIDEAVKIMNIDDYDDEILTFKNGQQTLI